MNFQKTIKIKFKKPLDPFTSMGHLISFYKNKEICAHLSFTWQSVLWFGYYSNGEWIDIKCDNVFSFFIQEKGFEFSIKIDDLNLYLVQSNNIQKYIMNSILDFDEIRYMENFKSNEIKDEQEVNFIKINELNTVEFSDECKWFKEDFNCKKAETDIILVSYLGFKWIDFTLKSLAMTYNANNSYLKINSIYYCDNNNEENLDKSLSIFNKYKNIFKDKNVRFEYIKNEDEKFCSNRVSAFKKALKFCKSELITTLDSDMFFLNEKWVELYKYFKYLDISGVVNSYNQAFITPHMRMGQIHLPRIIPNFGIFDINILNEKINEDPNCLNDLIGVESKYKNIRFPMFGMHFSKIYLDMLSEDRYFFKISEKSIASQNLELFSKEESIFFHFEQGSYFNKNLKNLSPKDKNKIKNCISVLEEVNTNSSNYIKNEMRGIIDEF